MHTESAVTKEPREIDLLDSKKKSEVREETLEQLGSELASKFKDFATTKQYIEKRMLQDYAQYKGLPFSAENSIFEQEPSTEETLHRSKIIVNVTRGRTDSAEAKLSDMLFASDERNYDFSATSDPMVAEALLNDAPIVSQGVEILKKEEEGEEEVPLLEKDIATAQMNDILIRSEKMRDVVDTQFINTRYPEEARNMIRDACQLGTGILKGPMQVGETQRVWIAKVDEEGNEVHMLETKVVQRPEVRKVSPWNFFPNLNTGSDIRDCDATFELHYKTAQQMLEYLKTPGFDEGQIRKILEAGPEATHLRSDTDYIEELRLLSDLGYSDSISIGKDSRYHVLEYHGTLSKEILKKLGQDLDEDEPLDIAQGMVWFAGGVVMKAVRHHLDSEDSLYSVLNWEKDEACIFGYGVPHVFRSSQKVVTAAWRMVLDNAGLSTGPQIVIDDSKIKPVNGKWELTPRKIWRLIDEDASISDVFKAFNIESHQSELIQIFNEAKRLLEDESSLVSPTQGQPATSGRTFTGLGMLMNTNNIMIKRVVRYYDDDITLPLVRRMYDWNMQFNPDNRIKGDFNIKALGSSTLLIKELQTQGLLSLLPYAEHPIYGPMMKPINTFKAAVKSLYLDPTDIMKDDQTIKEEAKVRAEQAANQPPQVSPDVQAKVDSQEKITQMQTDVKMAQLEESRMQLQLEFEKFMTAIASKEGISLEQIRKDYDIAEAGIISSDNRFYDELAIKLRTGSGI